MFQVYMLMIIFLHRHIGGLEIRTGELPKAKLLHRHIGGLENKGTHNEYEILTSPPHRRLRKVE